MSLQVWLPLTNGSIANQGLTTSTPVVNGATSSSSGKIGSCYYFDGSDDYINTKVYPSFGTGSFSIALWAYISSSGPTNYQALVCGKGASSSNVGCSIYWHPSQGKLLWSTANGSTGSEIWTASSLSSILLDKWNHIVMVRDVTKSPCGWFYINGVRYELASSPSILNVTNTTYPFWIGACPSNYYKTKMYANDVRIYDHALSAKEVKELSKGLVLHYTLADPYIEATTNYTPIPTTYGSTTSVSWDTALNGSTMYYPSNWGNGYNSGVSNPTTGYHAHWVWDDGKLVMLFPNRNSIISQQGRWLGISRSIATTGSVIPASTKYTVSWDQKTDMVGSYTTGGIYYYLTSSATSCNFHDGCPQIAKNTVAGEWQHFSYTFTRSSSFDSNTKGQSFYVYGTGGTEANIWVKNVQLEVKDHDTGYVNGNGTTASRTEKIEYDTSGYKNNGTVTGSLTLASDSARNNNSYYWPVVTSAANYITSPTLTFDGKGFTAAIWIKLTTGTAGGGTYHMPLESSSAGYYEMSIGSTGYLRAGIYVNGTRYVTNCSNSTMFDGKWHHIAITYNGSTICRYVDGVSYSPTTISGTANGTSQAFYLGKYGTNNDYYNKGVWASDARIYATALSASDIQELYNAPISIGNTSTVLTQGEIIEE